MSDIHNDYSQQLVSWKAERLAKLTATDGWLNLTDRLWLKNGTMRIGTAQNNDIVLSVGPEFIGTITQIDPENLLFQPENGDAAVELIRDPINPPRFSVGQLLLEITVTNGENALRVRDTNSTRMADFAGLTYFPTNPDWRIVADWVALEAPLELTVNTSKSILNDVKTTHKAVFEYAGKTYELLATHGTRERPQFVFRDETSKLLTYPAGRFLFGEFLTGNSIILDFNKAYNPPCAFTEHAVCPLPPEQNILPFSIPAGELKIV